MSSDFPELPDMGGLLSQVQQMQQQLISAQEEAASRVVEGQAGGGAVKVQMTGGFDFRKVTIDPAAVDPDDVGMLEDLILAALHDAVGRVNELNRQALGGLGSMGGLGGLLGGGLGGLGSGGGLDSGGGEAE
jgi:DNA-binding YbaB/EbfC family protein